MDQIIIELFEETTLLCSSISLAEGEVRSRLLPIIRQLNGPSEIVGKVLCEYVNDFFRFKEGTKEERLALRRELETRLERKH
jgi:hypothetical protein